MMDDIECFWNGTIATNDPLTNSMLPNWGYLNTFFRYIRKPGLFFVLWFLVFYLFSFFSSSWIAFYRTLIGVFLLFFQKNLPSYFFFMKNLNGFFTWRLKIGLCRLCHMWFSVRAKTVVWLTLQMVGNQNHIQYWAPLTET